MSIETLRALRERRFLPYLFQSLARDVTLTVLDVQPGERVLEIGLERGELLLKLATLTGAQGHVAGVDPDDDARALAEARLREVGYTHFALRGGAPGNLPFEAGAFDAVYASYLLGARDDAESKRVLADVRRVLRPGGRLAMCGFTVGESGPARAASGAYRAARRLAPSMLGVVRRAQALAVEAGFDVDRRLYVEQRGVPSEILLLCRRESLGVRG